MDLLNLETNFDTKYEKNTYFYKYFYSYSVFKSRFGKAERISDDELNKLLKIISYKDKDPLFKPIKSKFSRLSKLLNNWRTISEKLKKTHSKLPKIDIGVGFVREFSSDINCLVNKSTGLIYRREFMPSYYKVYKWYENEIKGIPKFLDDLNTCYVLLNEYDQLIKEIDDSLQELLEKTLNRLSKQTAIKTKQRTIEFDKISKKLIHNIYKKAMKNPRIGNYDELEDDLILGSTYDPQDGDYDGAVYKDYDGFISINHREGEAYVANLYKKVFANLKSIISDLNKIDPAIRFEIKDFGLVHLDDYIMEYVSVRVFCKNKTITENNLTKLKQILNDF